MIFHTEKGACKDDGFPFDGRGAADEKKTVDTGNRCSVLQRTVRLLFKP